MKAFGEGLGLKTVVDSIGNVIIYKAATPGMEDRKTVILQSHLDMVHQKMRIPILILAHREFNLILMVNGLKQEELL